MTWGRRGPHAVAPKLLLRPVVEVHSSAGADPGFLKGGGGSRLDLPAKKGGQTGVQFWAQC